MNKNIDIESYRDEWVTAVTEGKTSAGLAKYADDMTRKEVRENLLKTVGAQVAKDSREVVQALAVLSAIVAGGLSRVTTEGEIVAELSQTMESLVLGPLDLPPLDNFEYWASVANAFGE